MSNHLYADGATHNDHHKEINIQGNVTVEALKELANGFFADTVEAKSEPVDSGEVIDDELPSSRQEILEELLLYATKGDWIAPATVAGIQNYLRTVLNAGEKRLTGDDARMSADLWKMLEQSNPPLSHSEATVPISPDAKKKVHQGLQNPHQQHQQSRQGQQQDVPVPFHQYRNSACHHPDSLG